MTTITIKQNHVDGFSVKVNSNDPDMFRLTIDTLKSFIPATFRSYCPALKEWKVSAYAHDSLHRWLAYGSTHLRAQVEWLNAGTGQQRKAGWTRGCKLFCVSGRHL